jgi:hypothetical protein
MEPEAAAANPAWHLQLLSRFLQSPLRIHNQDEIGFSIGSAEPFKILWLSNPRAGFVFGGGLNVWHVNFGFPF